MASDFELFLVFAAFAGLMAYRQYQRKKWIEQNPQQYQAQLDFWARIFGK